MTNNDARPDVVIVATRDETHQKYWENRLRHMVKEPSQLVVVAERWHGEAGSGFGTLIALLEAQRELKNRGMNLFQMVEEGKCAFLYHTVGKGKRLAPLSLADPGGKAAVSLPGPTTLVEAVIHQTSRLATALAGRIGVFWCDQLFMPATVIDQPTHHISLLGINQSIDEITWLEEQFDRYGTYCLNEAGDATLLEKAEWEQFQKLCQNKSLCQGGMGASLGSFSISVAMVHHLLNEFANELEQRKGNLQTDSDLWMPLTTSRSVHAEITGDTSDHYDRMRKLRAQFSDPLVGVTDVGNATYWWDYGNLESFYYAHLLLTRYDKEAVAMRNFFQDPRHNFLGDVDLDGASYLRDCHIESGSIENSVLIGVRAKHVEVKQAVIIGARAPKILVDSALVYDVYDSEPVFLSDGLVRADIALPNQETVTLVTNMESNGNEVWATRLAGNNYSFQQVYHMFTRTPAHT